MMNMHTDPGSGHLSGREIDEVIDVEGTNAGEEWFGLSMYREDLKSTRSPPSLVRDGCRTNYRLVETLCWLLVLVTPRVRV